MNKETTLTLANGQFQFTTTGLIVTGQPNFETWENVGLELKYIEAAVHWWIGDWLNYGETRWGEDFAQVLDELDYSDRTLATDKYVAKAIPPSRRRDNLSFSHHREVAPLPPDRQDKVLALADEKRLNTRQVREIVKAERKIEPDYSRMVYNIIDGIQALAEVYPPGLQQIRDYLEAM